MHFDVRRTLGDSRESFRGTRRSIGHRPRPRQCGCVVQGPHNAVLRAVRVLVFVNNYEFELLLKRVRDLGLSFKQGDGLGHHCGMVD